MKYWNANNIRCSQAVTHPSTDRTRRCLTSLIGREAVYSTWCGRWRVVESVGVVLKTVSLSLVVVVVVAAAA